MIKIAIAMNTDHSFYHNNPYTASKFAVYTIIKNQDKVKYSLSAIFENPWLSQMSKAFEYDEINCSCSHICKSSLEHTCSHYAMLDVIGGCNYFLADHYCDNTKKALQNAGVTIFKIPPIINKVDIAIKNFLLGAMYASTVQHIHNAS